MKIENTEDDHVIHMWTPFSFHIDESYNYLCDTSLINMVHRGFRVFALLVLNIINHAFLGLTIEGEKNFQQLQNHGAITICNHVHLLDCSVLGCTFSHKRMYFLTLESNFKIPFIQHLVRLLGGVPLSNRPKQLKELFSQMQIALQKGNFVQIYPEGSLHPFCMELRPFKNGAFHLAVKSNMPIVPSVITYQQPQGLLKLIRQKPCLHLTVLPPVYPPIDLPYRQAVEELKQTCYQQMQKAILAKQTDSTSYRSNQI